MVREHPRHQPLRRAAAAAGACLLGSVNLTKFVKTPSPTRPRSTGEYRKVVRVFTRMLDNVVEVNGLPLRAAARGRSSRSAATAWASARQHHDHAEDEVRQPGIVRVHQRIAATDGGGGWEPAELGPRKRARRRSWRGVHRHRRMLRKAPRDGPRWLEGRPGSRANRCSPATAAHAARGRGRPGAGRGAG